MSEIFNILSDLKASGIVLTLDDTGSNLKLKGDLSKITLSDKDRLKQNKEQIIEFLKERSVKFPLAIPKSIDNLNQFLLSPNQKGIWFHEKIENLGNTYIIPAIYFYTLPNFKLSILEKSIQLLVEENQVFRLVFEEIDGKPQQRLSDKVELHKHFQIHSIENEENLDHQILQLNEEEILTQSIPLWRINLYELPGSKYCFYLRLHHLIGDGESLNLMIQKLIKNYQQIEKGLEISRENLIQYGDYVSWINNKEQFDQATKFWKNQFSGYEENFHLYSDFEGQETNNTSAGDTFIFDFAKPLVEKLRTWSVSNRASLASIYTSAVGIVLSKRGRSDDFVIGIPTASRNHPQLADLIGDLVNTLPLRMKIDYSMDSVSYIHSIQNAYLSVLDHQLYPFQYILEDIQFERKSNKHPLFNVMVSVPNNQTQSSSTESVSIKKATSLYDLTFTFIESVTEMRLAIEFLTSKFNATTIQNMFEEVEVVLNKLLEVPLKKLSSIYLTEQKEVKAKQFLENNNETVLDLFSRQVAKNPEFTAVEDEFTSLSYSSLDRLIDTISCYLLKEGLKPNSTVVVTLSRSIYHVASIYAIWRCGGIYVPIDAHLPVERQQYIKENCEPQLIIDEEFISKCKEQVFSEGLNSAPITGSSIAYLLYTSGTTGRPKGVMISHSALVLKLSEEAELLQIKEGSRTYTLTNPGFDVAFLETVLPISYGGTIVIADEAALQNTEIAINSILSRSVSHLQGTPTYFSHFVSLLKEDTAAYLNQSLRILSIGGESLTGYLVDKLKTKLPNVRINNHYGPTEITIDALVKENLRSFDSNIIGKPLRNTQAYVVDDFGNILPREVVGELVIGGPSVFSGYWKDQKLTGEKTCFLSHSKEPFYKTGDLVKLNLDGEFEFVGRKDNQVKLRGYRVELEEINQAILSMGDVNQAFSSVIDNVLVSWVVSQNQPAEIQEYLRKLLPEYMIPQVIESVVHFPMTENGKIAISQLPVPTNLHKEYVAPRTELEAQVVEIWQEVLGGEQVGVFDNFFELGGHSLTALQISARIQEKFGIYLELRDLLLNPTVYNLSNKLNLKIQLKDQENLFPKMEDFITIDL